MLRQARGAKCAAVLEEEIVVQIVELCLIGVGVSGIRSETCLRESS